MFVGSSRFRQILGCLGCLALLFVVAMSAGPVAREAAFTRGHEGQGILMGAYDPYGTFANDPKTEKSDLLIDMKKTVYGLAFHPQFAKNRYVYLT